MKSFDVRVWSTRKITSTKKPTYQLRWKVGKDVHYATFATAALADSYRARLLTAARNGEGFDTTTGLPDSMAAPKRATTWFAFARRYVVGKWPHAAAKSRESTAETLTVVTMALLADRTGRPDEQVLWRVLRTVAFVPPAWPGDAEDVPDDLPAADRAALAWAVKSSPELACLADPVVMREVLDALKLCRDGRAAAAETVRRKRAVFHNVMEYAVERREFEDNPIDAVAWKAPRVAKTVDRRVVANPRQARDLLTAVSYVGHYKRARGRRLTAFFACLYYAGMRPAEALGLRRDDCHLPEEGWGRLILEQTRPTAGKRWTDSGAIHDDRGLKNRPADETRPVPIPPVLVAILRAHLQEFGTAPDGRLFFNERKGIVVASTYSRVWKEARALALTPAQVRSPLAKEPYDLRHAALSTWLNAGVDPTEVAERAGNSVEVLLTRYAKCLDGRDAANNRRIEQALDDSEE